MCIFSIFCTFLMLLLFLISILSFVQMILMTLGYIAHQCLPPKTEALFLPAMLTLHSRLLFHHYCHLRLLGWSQLECSGVVYTRKVLIVPKDIYYRDLWLLLQYLCVSAVWLLFPEKKWLQYCSEDSLWTWRKVCVLTQHFAISYIAYIFINISRMMNRDF